MTAYLVERYLPNANEQDIRENAQRAAHVTTMMRAEGRDVVFLGATLLRAEETCFDLFEAPTAELVIEANRRAALPFHKIQEAIHIGAEPVVEPPGSSRSAHEVRGSG